MSIHAVHTEDFGETLNEAAARRLRGRMAELKITDIEIARAIHMTQASFNRRKNGVSPLMLNDLAAIEQATGGRISVAYLLGLNDERTPSPLSDGVLPLGVRPPGLEPGTH